MPFVKGVSGNPGGRPAGRLNRSTQEIRALSRALFDDEYWKRIKAQLRDGSLPPIIESKLLSYAYGEPKSLDAAGPISVQIGFLQTMQEDAVEMKQIAPRVAADTAEGMTTAARLALTGGE